MKRPGLKKTGPYCLAMRLPDNSGRCRAEQIHEDRSIHVSRHEPRMARIYLAEHGVDLALWSDFVDPNLTQGVRGLTKLATDLSHQEHGVNVMGVDPLAARLEGFAPEDLVQTHELVECAEGPEIFWRIEPDTRHLRHVGRHHVEFGRPFAQHRPRCKRVGRTVEGETAACHGLHASEAEQTELAREHTESSVEARLTQDCRDLSERTSDDEIDPAVESDEVVDGFEQVTRVLGVLHVHVQVEEFFVDVHLVRHDCCLRNHAREDGDVQLCPIEQPLKASGVTKKNFLRVGQITLAHSGLSARVSHPASYDYHPCVEMQRGLEGGECSERVVDVDVVNDNDGVLALSCGHVSP